MRRKKRGGGGHHGGAWKIAFADFMTAMMALFLVLWLVNAANEETKKSVASYFNPVKLVDRYRSERGLSEADGPSRKRTEGDETTAAAIADENASATEGTEQETESGERRTAAFFADADAVIDDLTKAAEALAIAERETPVAASEIAPERLRDPFATDIVVEAALRAENGDAPDRLSLRVAALEVEQTDSLETASDAFAPPPVQSPPVNSLPVPDEPAASAFEPDERKADVQEISSENNADEGPSNTPLTTALVEALAAASGARKGVHATVTETADGTLVSLTDSTGEPMFERSSAQPTVMLVRMLNGLADTIAGERGTIRISGHTDATPFARTSGYDNWRLSTDRANTARMILEKAGVGPATIASVSGFADRRPIRSDDRFAAENRRIEILLENGA